MKNWGDVKWLKQIKSQHWWGICGGLLSEYETSLAPFPPFQSQYKNPKLELLDKEFQFLFCDFSWMERSWGAWRWRRRSFCLVGLLLLWCMNPGNPRAAVCTPCFSCTICCACCNVKYCQTHTHLLQSRKPGCQLPSAKPPSRRVTVCLMLHASLYSDFQKSIRWLGVHGGGEECSTEPH